MSERPTIIELKKVQKKYGDAVVVEDFNLEVKKGEFITLLGPSGCGKTTTLRMIAGFEKPTSGEILLNGQDIVSIPPHKRPVNTVFQRYALFPHYDVYDNIAFGLKLKRIPTVVKNKKGEEKIKMVKLSAVEIDQKVAKALKIVDLEEMEDRDISTLSGGQQQRVAIARAIVNEPEILLLDEPLGALDLKLREDMQIELKEMHKKLGITFIYVTHDQQEALTMSDRIVIMNSGEIQQIGTPTDIYNEPVNSFVANFIGESNIFNAVMTGEKKVRFLGRTFECMDSFPKNEKVDVVVRPEDIKIKMARKDDADEGEVKGKIINRIFKGVHYEYTVKIGRNQVSVQNTREFPLDGEVLIKIAPEAMHVMNKELNENVYNDTYIDKQNRLVLNEEFHFEVDITKLLPNSTLSDDGYLVSETGVKYDLTDLDVTTKIPLDAITLSDEFDESLPNGEIVSNIYKGDHYEITVRTPKEEDFVLVTDFNYTEGEYVNIIIDKEKISISAKGDLKEYEL